MNIIWPIILKNDISNYILRTKRIEENNHHDQYDDKLHLQILLATTEL